AATSAAAQAARASPGPGSLRSWHCVGDSNGMKTSPLSFVLAACVFAACGSSEPPRICTPYSTMDCACDGGPAGTQTCDPSGTSYGSCRCPMPLPDLGP